MNVLRGSILGLLVWGGWSLAAAAPLTTGADFLLMTTGARPDGMGQAFSAVADDINSLSFNPAGLGNVHVPQVGYGYESFPAGLQYDFVGAGIPFSEAGVLGLAYIDMGAGTFNSTADPTIPSVTVMDRAFVAGWGKSFYNLQVGAAAKYITRQLDTLNANGWAFDIGLRYKIINSVTLAGSLMNFGSGIQVSSTEPLPTFANLGIGYTAIEQPSHTLNLVGNMAFDVNTNTQRFSAGAEYWYMDQFALRAGYLFHSLDTTFNSDGFSAGAGVRVSFLELDYAFQPFNTLGMVHRVSGMLRWEGPWLAGGEPDSPRYVDVKVTPKALEVRWEKATGSIAGYEVLIQPLDGRPMIVSEPVVNPIYYFKDLDPDTLYRISVRTIGEGGGKSFPSRQIFALSNPENYNGNSNATERSVARGVQGATLPFGLELSWNAPEGYSGKGFHIYRRSPSGQIERVTSEPKSSNRVWMTDVTGLQGWEWIVTALSPDGKTEKKVGSFLWFPTNHEMDSIMERPTLRLHASTQPDRKLYLDWDGDPNAAGYALFFSRQNDNIYELFRTMDKPVPNSFLQISGGHNQYFFMVVPKDSEGRWLSRTQGAKAEFFTEESADQDNP